MKKLSFPLLISAGLLLTFGEVYSQYIPGALGYHEQALMFSKYDLVGSARIQGLGNTQISLGGDVSSALSNPAGLGFYNRSEVSITPSYNIFSSKSNYIGTERNSQLGKFNIDNLGAVFNRIKDDAIPGKWRGGSFAISYSKINEFNSDLSYSGSNQNNDILDFYVQEADFQNVDPNLLGGVTYGAFSTFLISDFLDAYISGNDTTFAPFYFRTFFGQFPTGENPTLQEELISSTGSQNQWSFSYGGNFDDFLYFGATLGVQSLRYNIVKQYTETYPSRSGRVLENSVLTEDLLTQGIGVNGTFGIIARPIKQMTLGLSLITPTYMAMDERYYYSTESKYNNFSMTDYGQYFDANYQYIVNPDADFTTFYEFTETLNLQSYDEESLFEYSITSPLRLNAGATFFVGKNGFLSADIEFVDYSKMKIKDDQGQLQDDNATISMLYKSVANLRVGGEWRMKAFRFRAGYNYQPSPYINEEVDGKVQTYSAGIGLRSKKFFGDLSASYRQLNNVYAPYVLDNPNGEDYLETSTVEFTNNNLNFALSLGLFF